MGVRGRTVAMPGPQTARTVNPLGGKGAGTIHGYQIMTAPRRHPLQCLAALARKSHQELSWDLDLSDNIIGFNNLYKTDKEVP